MPEVIPSAGPEPGLGAGSAPWCLTSCSGSVPQFTHLKGGDSSTQSSSYPIHTWQDEALRPPLTYLARHEEEQRSLLFFGFVLGDDFFSYGLNQLFRCLRLSVIL